MTCTPSNEQTLQCPKFSHKVKCGCSVQRIRNNINNLTASKQATITSLDLVHLSRNKCIFFLNTASNVGILVFFKMGHCKDTPVSRSPWNDEKTKETSIFIGLQKSDQFTQVKVGLLRHFFMHQWLDVFTTDLNIFEYVHASVNIPTFHFASVLILWHIFILVPVSPLPGSIYPWFNLPQASSTEKVIFFVFNLC